MSVLPVRETLSSKVDTRDTRANAKSRVEVLGSLEYEITCPVCHEYFVDPKILPCCHYYCKHCVHSLVATAGKGKPISCPECRRETFLTSEGVERLATVSIVRKLVSAVNSVVSEGEGGATSAAGLSSSSRSSAAVRRSSSSSSSSSAGSVSRGVGDEANPHICYHCPDHQAPMKFYCFSCKAPVCSDCILDSHADHPYEYTSVAAKMFRDSIGENEVSLRDLKTSLELAIARVEERKAEVAQQFHLATSAVTERFNDLTMRARRRGDQVTRTLAELAESKLAVVGEQRRALCSVVSDLNTFLDAFSTVMASPIVEYLSVVTHGTLLSEALYHREKCTALTLEPSEVPNICVSLPDANDVRNACVSRSEVYLCEAFGPGLVKAELGKSTSFSILPLAPVLLTPKVHVTMTSLADGADVNVSMTESPRGGIEATYRPTARGWHRLCVELWGVPIRGSPFSVAVTLPSTRFKRPVRKIRDVTHPHGIAFVRSGTMMVVTEFGANRVTVRSKDGADEVELEGHPFDRPWGVDVDCDGNIYVSEEGSNRIAKFTSDGKYVKSAGSRGAHVGELDGPRGVRVIRGLLYVAERNNSRVQVFDPSDLRPMEVLCDGMPRLTTDVAASSCGHLFVSGTGSAAVQVFSLETRAFLHSIQHSDLQQPSGLCYDDLQDLLYVADPGSGCVFAFKADGMFVARFCDAVADTGLLLPWSVAVDSSVGFVYVCDTSNCQILIF